MTTVGVEQLLPISEQLSVLAAHARDDLRTTITDALQGTR